MNNAELKEEHAKIEKLLKFQEDVHSKKFITIASEGAYRDSCERISGTYQRLCESGERLGITYPVRF